MKNPPAATAAVAAHDPVRAVVPAREIPFRGSAARPGCAAACPEWDGDFRSDHACYILAFRSDFPEEETGVGVCPGGDLCGAHRRVRRGLPRDRVAAPAEPA